MILVIIFNILFVFGNLFMISVFHLQGPVVYRNEDARKQFYQYYNTIKLKLSPIIDYIKGLLDSKHSLDYVDPITLSLFFLWCYTKFYIEDYYYLHFFITIFTLIAYFCYGYIIYTQGFWTYMDRYEIEELEEKYTYYKNRWNKIKPYIIKAFSHPDALDVMHPIAEGSFYIWFLSYWFGYIGYFILITPILILSYISFFSILYLQGFWTYLDKWEIREMEETYCKYRDKYQEFKRPIVRFLSSPLAFQIAYHYPKFILSLWFVIKYSLG